MVFGMARWNHSGIGILSERNADSLAGAGGLAGALFLLFCAGFFAALEVVNQKIAWQIIVRSEKGRGGGGLARGTVGACLLVRLYQRVRSRFFRRGLSFFVDECE